MASSPAVDPEKEAWNLLRAAVVNYCGSPIAGTPKFFNFSVLNLATSGSRCVCLMYLLMARTSIFIYHFLGLE